jgi:hypothetical protein
MQSSYNKDDYGGNRKMMGSGKRERERERGEREREREREREMITSSSSLTTCGVCHAPAAE